MKGGRRPGAGRPRGKKNADPGIVELARQHSKAAIDALLEAATQGESEGARVSAACALLDRGHGKPSPAEPSNAANAFPSRTPAELDAIFAEKIRESNEWQKQLYRSRAEFFAEKNPALAERFRRELAELESKESNGNTDFSTRTTH
ncbi:MAG: hypothetical protein LBS70_02715 [Candidatus Accumulibacter sp.]|jgi:hypothetical protein|nr:hypothetical protein [Accumulibacter sp.]